MSSCCPRRSRIPRARIRSPPGSGSVRHCAGSCRAGSGVGSSSSERELDRGKTVDHAVMGLADDRQTPVRGVLADPHLPKRAVATQRYRHHLVDQTVERARCPVDVPIDREGGIVDPLGGVEAERHRCQLLPVAWSAVDPQLGCDRAARRSSAAVRRRRARTAPPSRRACARSASRPRGTRRRAPTVAGCSFGDQRLSLDRAQPAGAARALRGRTAAGERWRGARVSVVSPIRRRARTASAARSSPRAASSRCRCRAARRARGDCRSRPAS